jgi:hypothetical protein
MTKVWCDRGSLRPVRISEPTKTFVILLSHAVSFQSNTDQGRRVHIRLSVLRRHAYGTSIIAHSFENCSSSWPTTVIQIPLSEVLVPSSFGFNWLGEIFLMSRQLYPSVFFASGAKIVGVFVWAASYTSNNMLAGLICST